ncbi:MAG: TerC family protein [Dehalococcoidales bacterium]
MSHETILWIVFAVVVPVILVLDLAVFQRKAHSIKTKEALLMTAGYMSVALLFAVAVYFMLGQDKSFTFLTGYIVEQSLSMDNLFVFILIFSSFVVPSNYQHRVLFWGIVGAMVMRGAFIGSGWALLNALHWVIYIFGAFLVYTGIKIATKKDAEINPKKNVILRLCTKYLPVTDDYRDGKFFSRENGRLLATPLLLVLLVVETTDIVFAVDSIPAVLSITSDLFIIYTSNIFAILGLRALYFAIAGVTKKLAYINYGLAAILALLGIKMLISSWIEVPVPVSLGAVVGILAIAALASYWWPPKKKGVFSKEFGDDIKK